MITYAVNDMKGYSLMVKKKKNKKNKIPRKIKYAQVMPEETRMTLFLIFNDDEYQKEHVAYSKMKTAYGELMIKTHSPVMPSNLNIMKAFTDTEENIAGVINHGTSIYMGIHECDEGLDITEDYTAVNTRADVIDFTEFEHEDILRETMLRLKNRELLPNDISLLWSTNEYVKIIISPSLEYAVKRLRYDEEKALVYYEIVCYDKRVYFEKEIMTIPTLVCQIALAIKYADDIHIKDDTETSQHNKTALQWSTMHNIENMLNGTVDKYIYPVYIVDKMDNIISYKRYFKKLENETFNKNEQTAKVYMNTALDMICAGVSTGKAEINEETCVSYARQKISVAIAAIILTNLMLQSEKLSAPVSPKSNKSIKYEINTSGVNADDTLSRKTRNLGSLKITSERRPTAPNMNKIIRFTKAEWGRRGFVRHYKNGKTVFIKPTTVKRRCVDMTNMKTLTETTRYVIHSDNTDE